MSDFDKIYVLPEERQIDDREPNKVPVLHHKIISIAVNKSPVKELVVYYCGVDASGKMTMEDQMILRNNAFQQFHSATPEPGETWGKATERMVYEALVAKGKISADAVETPE